MNWPRTGQSAARRQALRRFGVGEARSVLASTREQGEWSADMSLPLLPEKSGHRDRNGRFEFSAVFRG